MNLGWYNFKILSLVLVTTVTGSLSGQDEVDNKKAFLTNRDFGSYYLADMYSPANRILYGFGTNAPDYNAHPDPRGESYLLNEFTLGYDFAVYNGPLKLGKRNYRLSVSTSTSASVFFDPFCPHLAPILNVDYRLGIPEIYLVRRFNNRYLKNALLRVSLIQHESTHIGDEIALYRANAQIPLVRINVSYESGELSLTINDPFGTTSSNHSATIGAKFLYPVFNDSGYYFLNPGEGDPAFLERSRRWIEGYVRYQFDGVTGPLRIGNFYPVVSAELRNRVRFSYSSFAVDPLTPEGWREIRSSEKYVPCLNLYAGWKDRGHAGKPGRLGVYLRYYTGINPHGQFRNNPEYSFAGLAVVVEN